MVPAAKMGMAAPGQVMAMEARTGTEAMAPAAKMGMAAPGQVMEMVQVAMTVAPVHPALREAMASPADRVAAPAATMATQELVLALAREMLQEQGVAA